MILNSSFTSLLVFIYFGQVGWLIALAMGACLIMVAYIDALSAIDFGAKFIHTIFILIVVVTAIKLRFNAWLS